MRRSSPPSELFDLERDLPVSAEDVAALRRLRGIGGSSPLTHPEELSPSWPSPPDVATRPTAAGREPFEL
jgi:hypothetical protein